MGTVISKNIILVGPSGGGKTTLLNSLKHQRSIQSFDPSAVYNVEVVKYSLNSSRFLFHVFDLPGDENLQSLWSHFYTQVRVDYVCYVVDSSDEAALKREYASLHTLINESDLANATFVVVINQKSSNDSLSAAHIRKMLQLDDIPYRQVDVCRVNAKSGGNLGVLMQGICLSAIKR